LAAARAASNCAPVRQFLDLRGQAGVLRLDRHAGQHVGQRRAGGATGPVASAGPGAGFTGVGGLLSKQLGSPPGNT
jgi:hypothetical protein